eukprot:CAMPEP_0117668126 /NCGR_PEP_ID=MMETSP0804-20121206/11361_1 /TAXON_ID=1074897 /ORGANISM="Tetraselmis astigmatica, Strain CCMP880" /LENGTH=175 /DNA_ID=CAMNT_0005475953 /DNA_START=96 /DNA_END=625 /DNA_ORIENTATION=-
MSSSWISHTPLPHFGRAMDASSGSPPSLTPPPFIPPPLLSNNASPAAKRGSEMPVPEGVGSSGSPPCLHSPQATWKQEGAKSFLPAPSVSCQYQAIFDATQPKGTSGDMHSDIGLVATLRGSSELEEILVPSRRWEQPVDDTAISQAAAIFHFPSRDVLAHVDRARNQALASAAR